MAASHPSPKNRPYRLGLVPSAGARPSSVVANDVRMALATALSDRRPGGVAYLVVDVENMCLVEGEGGKKKLDEVAFRRLCEGLATVADSSIRLVYGYSHYWADRFRFELPGGRHLWGSGPNGAENALIEAVRSEGLPLGTGSMIVLSGDHAMTGIVAAISAVGITTWAVAREGTLARSLELAAHHSITIAQVSDPVSNVIDERALTLAGGGDRVPA